MTPALLGIALGLALALAATPLLSGLLFGLSPHEPALFLGAPLLLAACALLASYLPTRCTTRIAPATALRAG